MTQYKFRVESFQLVFSSCFASNIAYCRAVPAIVAHLLVPCNIALFNDAVQSIMWKKWELDIDIIITSATITTTDFYLVFSCIVCTISWMGEYILISLVQWRSWVGYNLGSKTSLWWFCELSHQGDLIGKELKKSEVRVDGVLVPSLSKRFISIGIIYIFIYFLACPIVDFRPIDGYCHENF